MLMSLLITEVALFSPSVTSSSTSQSSITLEICLLRLMGHFKGIKITPDNSRSYPTYRNSPKTQLTTDHIFGCKAIIFASTFKDASSQDIFYSPQAPDLGSLVIGALGPK
ncbi:hypothetical protein TNCV_2355781 [Trichonephila clavipes]|nr:hypothetical protein TNCV_2355781 [Trichonephila clavipes]